MSVKLSLARAAASASTFGLQHVLHRPGANFPGKVALYADHDLIADLRPGVREGVVVVVGTNGKTTVTGLVADALEASGKAVACNRTGANLDSGIATALLHDGDVDWGVFECDEIWLARVAPQLKPDYVVLLNLFRDQLDRAGEIALVQEGIAGALGALPETTLVYNADDPFCQGVADRIPNRCIAFGIGEDLGLPQNSIADSDLCQRCDAQLEYAWRQYGQLGNYRCPSCGFARTQPAYSARDIDMTDSDLQLTLSGGGVSLRLGGLFPGTYMAYNVLAAYAASDLCGSCFQAFERAVRNHDPRNGRLERFRIGESDVLLNLAKNPAGLNQNLKLVTGRRGQKAVAFFINDHEADGHDVSWLWDVDFQELAWAEGLDVYAGGLRRNDLQVRLKHAGVDAQLVDGARDFMQRVLASKPGATCFLVANYTALPGVRSQLVQLAQQRALTPREAPRLHARDRRAATPLPKSGEELKIVHLYPKLLNLYGDGGNVTVLANRARWRGICVDTRPVSAGQGLDLDDADIVFMGGGPDREQRLASQLLGEQADALRAYVESDGVLLAICGGFQILGREWLLGNEPMPGLGILDAVTKRAPGNARNRLVGNIAVRSPLADMPVVGYENHAGRTFLGPGCEPFGHVIGRHGHGNNDSDHVDGARYRNVVGTYLHGPLLSKNPEVADWMIATALARRAALQGLPGPDLPPLDDAVEQTANATMRHRMGMR